MRYGEMVACPGVCGHLGLDRGDLYDSRGRPRAPADLVAYRLPTTLDQRAVRTGPDQRRLTPISGCSMVLCIPITGRS